MVNGKADRYRISKITRAKVEEMARQMGYGPDNNRSTRQMAAHKHELHIANNAYESDHNHNILIDKKATAVGYGQGY